MTVSGMMKRIKEPTVWGFFLLVCFFLGLIEGAITLIIGESYGL